MGMFDFLFDAGNYEARCVGRFDAPWGFVSTASVSDGRLPFETAVRHTAYRETGMVIVAAYASRDAAEKGHATWVAKMTAKTLPESITDVANAGVCELGEVFGADMRETYKRRDLPKKKAKRKS